MTDTIHSIINFFNKIFTLTETSGSISMPWRENSLLCIFFQHFKLKGRRTATKLSYKLLVHFLWYNYLLKHKCYWPNKVNSNGNIIIIIIIRFEMEFRLKNPWRICHSASSGTSFVRFEFHNCKVKVLCPLLKQF